MNKLSIRILILLIFASLAAVIILKVRSPFGKENSTFASSPVHEITRIELSQEGKKLQLSKNDGIWIVNGRNEVRKSAINYFLQVLTDLKIKSTVSSDFFNTEIISKGIKPVKVRVYEKGKTLQTFLVYKTGSNTYGNIMKIREHSMPFIVYVPGFEGEIGSAFTLNELYWQPYTVYDLLPSEIKSIRFENLSDTSSSFTIVNKNRRFYLKDDIANKGGWDSSRVFRYVSYFARVPFESWAFDISAEDQKRITCQQPIYRITVTGTDNTDKILTIWAIARGNNTDSDRVYGKTDKNGSLFIMRYFDIDPLIKKKAYFFGSQTP